MTKAIESEPEDGVPMTIGPLKRSTDGRMVLVRVSANWPTDRIEQVAARRYARYSAVARLSERVRSRLPGGSLDRVDVLVLDAGLPPQTAHPMVGAMLEGLCRSIGPALTVIVGYKAGPEVDHASWRVAFAEHHGNPFERGTEFGSLTTIRQRIRHWEKPPPPPPTEPRATRPRK